MRAQTKRGRLSLPPPDTGALILAAGRSRRFGSDKRIHLLADTIQRYQETFDHVRVVLRADDGALLEQLGVSLRAGDSVVHAQDADLGMGHSLAAGVEGLTWTGLFVGLGDMPYVQRSTLLLLKEALESAVHPGIVRPYVADQAGQPVGFTADFLSELCALEGDAGARQLIRRHADSVIRLQTDDSGVLDDVDTPDAVRR